MTIIYTTGSYNFMAISLSKDIWFLDKTCMDLYVIVTTRLGLIINRAYGPNLWGKRVKKVTKTRNFWLTVKNKSVDSNEIVPHWWFYTKRLILGVRPYLFRKKCRKESINNTFLLRCMICLYLHQFQWGFNSKFHYWGSIGSKLNWVWLH